MKNWEKLRLKQMVALEINVGHNLKTAINIIEKHGFKPVTIRRYYSALGGFVTTNKEPGQSGK